MNLFFVSHRFRRLNFPGAMLLALLQRTPAIRVAAVAESVMESSPVANVLRSALTAVASLGAVQSMAGATPLSPSQGTASGITVTTGTSVNVLYTVTGTQTPPASWTVSGTIPAGLNFSGLTGSGGTVNVTDLNLKGTPTTAGTFQVTITAWEGTNGSLIPSPDYKYTITVNSGGGGSTTAPSISAQPQGQTVTAGAAASFSVTATGSPTPTYQWKKGSTTLSGATAATLNLSNVQASDAGTYTVVVTNSAGSVTSQGATLTVNSAPSITAQPLNQTVLVGGSASFSVTATGTPTPTYQWQKDATNVPGATAATLNLSNAQTGDAGNYTVVVTNSIGSATSNIATLTVSATGIAPAITAGSPPQSVIVGDTVTLNVTATGSPNPTFQWKKDGTPVAVDAHLSVGVTGALTITGVTMADAGTYTVVASNTAGSTTSAGVLLTVNPAPISADAAWLTNVSVRTTMLAGQTPLIVGVYVQGGAKNILVRGAGPALAAIGLPGTMVDPKLQLYQNSTVLLTNDDWDPSLSTTFDALGAFGFPAGSKDAAFVSNLNGGYTVQALPTGPGTLLVEVYDTNPSSNSPRLINISARNRVGTGNDVLIAGFSIAGSGTKKVLIRAVGPRLADFGISTALVDPKLSVYSGTVKIAENDNWDASLATTFSAVSAFDLVPGSKDAAMVVPLAAGHVYTVQASGADGGTGDALIEVYEVP